MGQHFTSVARGLNMGSFVESKEEFLEKGRKAQIGEIREWKGQKFQKQPNGGWIPVKQGTKDSKKEGELNWKKVTEKDMAALPVGTKISYYDNLSGTDVVTTKVKENFWEADGNTYTDEEVSQSVSHPDAENHKMEKPAAEKKEEKKEFTPEQEKWLDRFFDPSSSVDFFMENSSDETYPNKSVEEFEKFISSDDENGGEGLGVDSLVSELNLSVKEATDLYKERSKKMLEDIKKSPEKYGFETEPENKAIAGVKDWIGDEASDQEISDVLDAVEDFVSPSMLKIQANSPLQFGEKVYDRADEIMEKYREHFDHWDGTDSMPDKQLRKILVAIMYDKRQPRA